jgi:alpha-tubulin suppressor-like RCC1 family protein/subtilisin-like proprotein convertase family protein
MSKIIMRRHPLTWFFVLLLCAAGGWLLLRQNHISHISKVKVTPSAAEQFTSAWKSLPHRVASQNAIKAAVASTQTNNFAWRLSNTSKPLKQLMHDPHAILLENAFIDTSAKTINLPIPNNLRSQGDPGAYVVQANGTISPAFRAMLAQAGATMVSYIPNNAYLVRATETVANDLAANPQVQAVVPYEPYYKVQAPLLALADQPLPANVQLNLALFPDSAAATLQQIEQLGGILISEQNSLAGYPIVKVEPPPNWTAVAQLAGVHIVEPYFRRGLANDLARPALGVAADPFTPTNYLNLQGLNVTVEVNDSGIDTNHPDLQGRVFFNDPAEGIDIAGHGTHVAGIIAGSGLESPTVTNASIDTANLTALVPGYFGIPGTNGQFRGKAPLANMFAMNFQDDDLTLQETAATNNALISNNSWNFAGDFGYDLEAASYDAATRDALPFTTGAQPVLFVFSSGNDGGGNEFNVDGNNPDSIDSPATAKDVMTVGALEEDRMITNIVTNADGTVSAIWQGQTDDSSGVPGFSSSGNVGIGTEGTFGRYKPDVVAPGTFVISCRSSEWETNSYFNPTNDNIDVFPDFIEGDSVSVAPFDFFVPSTAVEIIFTMVTNLESPSELPTNMPVYISNGTPTPSPYTFVGAGPNSFEISPAAALDQDWSVEVSNTTTGPIAYDLIVDVLTTNNAGDYYQVLFGMDDGLGVQSQPQFYRYETGTSMSAAAISGFLADIEDYFTNQLGLMPSPALLKAMTINGARAIGTYKFQVQNTINEAGWGLPDLSNSVPTALTNIPVAGQINTLGPACSTFFRDQNVSNALATGDSETFNVTVNTNDDAQDQPLRFTVAWTDPPGDPSAGIKLVNSLELVVTDLDNPSIIYYGNDIGPDQTFNTAESTNTAPAVDNVNNIQNIFIFPPLDSHYSVTVIGSSVNVNAVTEQTNNDVQDFAMVISSGDMGEITDALMVADGGIVSNPTGDQNISFAVTNSVLLNQTAGANTPLLGTNTIPLTMMGANSQFTIGMTNEWHFYLVTNLTTFTNAVFITFNAETLATPRMGVLADSVANSTVPGPDLDMLVTRSTTDGNAAELTNLWPSVVSNCLYSTSGDGSSLVSGGTDFVAYTNAAPNEVFYVGVKSENHMAVQYDFVPIFTQTPFGGQDTNGNQYLNSLNVPQPIAEGTPSAPSKTFVFMLDLNPVQIQNVVVTNTILAQNFGSLVGSIKHNGKTVVLNNHDSLGSPPGPYRLIYDDSGQNTIPGSRPSDGPGSLRSYDGADGTGIWQLTEEGTTLAQTGVVENCQIFLEKHQDPQNGINVVLQPGEWFYDFVAVPPGITNLEIFGTNLTATLAPQSIQMFLLEGAPPTANDFDFEVPLNQGIPPGNEISDGPPLAPDIYWIGLFNPNLSGAAQDVFLLAVLNGISTVRQPTLFTDTNSTPITIDAVTNTTIVVSNANIIASVNVGMVVQYPRMSDLAFTLISPTGQRILLMENRGGPTATNAGDVFFITNSIGTTTASGTSQATTNTYNVQNSSGSLNVSYNMFTVPDQMTIYYGNDPTTFNPIIGNPNLLYNSGMVSGTSNFTVNFGPGTSTSITVIMNQLGNTNGSPGQDAWTYTLGGTFPDYNFLTFTEDTNLTDIPIKFATPPFDLRDLGTNYTFGNLDSASNGDYFGQTNINDAFGGWFVPSNLVAQVTNGVVYTNNYNEVSVVSDPAIAFGSSTNSSNFLALGYGVIQRTNLVAPFRLDSFTYEYRGPGIAGWWRGEGDARDSSDAEQKGQNGSLIGRFDFPAGEVSQAFAMENNGGEFDFAGTNGYVQIRQQPFLIQVSTNSASVTNGDPGAGFATVQSSFLDVGTGPGLTVEGWINPTNVSFQQPLVEWLTRVPTNGSDTNLFIRAGPFLDRATDHYYYMLGATDWLTSEQWAEDLGGHLATVDTADEQNWIFDTFAGYAGKSRNLWIGLTNLSGVSGIATNFVYSSGATNLYFNWLSTQPNDTCRDADYTFMFGNTNTYRGLWTLASDFGVTCDDPTNTNVVYGVVEVTNQMTNGVQFWISVTTVPGATNVITTNTGCLFANVVDSTNGSHWIYSAPGLVQSNLFQHVALTYNTNSGIANLYYNGTNVASTNWGGIHFIPKTTGDVLLGKDMNLESSNYYGGLMDEVSIYGRALSDAEIQAIYSVSAFTTNRLIGKFDPTVTPPESLAEAQVVLGDFTNTILGANSSWQQGSFTFTTQTNALFMQILGLQPGMLLDDFSLSQAPLGNLYYQPEQSLDELKGESAQGNWTLEIWDTRLNVLATNAEVINWQLQMILQTNNLLPVPFGSEEPNNITVMPGQITTLAITVPSWVTVTTNRLISSTLPLNVFVNTNAPPTGSFPPDYFLYSSSGPNNSGSAVLDAATTPPTPPIAPAVPPAFIPGQTYYIGLQNPGTTAASVVFEVDFNIIALTNDIPFSGTLATNTSLSYYSFDVTTNNPYEATFQLLNQSGNADLVISKGGPLPTLTTSAYGSFNSGRADENIYVLTNSSPVPLTPGTWFLGVFNRDSGAVNYTVLAKELDLSPTSTTNLTLVQLTDGVPLNFTSGPGAALTNFFYFIVTNNVAPGVTNVGSIRFALFNETGNAGLTVQTNIPPFAPPFFQSSDEPGTLPNFIQIQTNSALTNLNATWYLGVPNNTTNLINYTIVAVIDTNNVFPAFPGAQGAGAGALGAGLRNGFSTNNTVYHVFKTNDDGTFGTFRDAVSSTNRTIIFDISGVIYLQSPLTITNSYLTIAGQTAPPGGITLAGAPVTVQNAHDIILRDLRLRSSYAALSEDLFSSDYANANVYKFTASGVQSTFASLPGNLSSIAFDSAGNLFVAGNGTGAIYKITPGGVVSTFATIPGSAPLGLAFNSAGDLFMANYFGNNIYEITPGGAVSVFASGGGLDQPAGLAFNSAGVLFVANIANDTISEITPGGVVSTFVNTGLNFPYGLAFDGAGNLYVGNYDNYVAGGGNITKITPGGVESIFANGLTVPNYLAFNPAGDLLMAQGKSPNILEFSPTGTLLQTTVVAGGADTEGLAFTPFVISGVQAGGGAYSLQLNTVSNVIADHLSITWSTNDNLYIENSTNATVQWSIISDSIHVTNGFGSGSVLDTNNGGISLHHNLYADNAYANPQLNGNVTLDFVNNVIYDWGTNAGISANDSSDTFTNYLNYVCNYVIASTNSLTNYIAFWGGTTNTWIYQTNNFIDSDTNGILNGANTQWNMFTNLFTPTNQFPLPQPSVDEAYQAYEKVLDFAGVDMYKRDFIDSNIVENVRRQDGSIISLAGALPTLSSTLIYQDSVNDGVPDFWKITYGQAVTNKENNGVVDASGYSELEEFDNWLAIPHALTYTNQPVGVNLQKLFGRTGNLSFYVTNAWSDHGLVYLTNVLGSFTNTSLFSNSIAIFTPTNELPFTTNYSGFGSFGVVVTNNDTLGYFGPVPVSVFISAVPPSFSEMGTLTNGTTNVIGANSIVWYLINVPTNAVQATNSLLYAGAPMNLWYSTNVPPTIVNPGDFELLSGSTNGSAIINVAGAPLPPVLQPGGTYYLGVQNTNSFPTNYAVSVTFDTPLPPIIIIIITPGQPITNVIPAVVSSGGISPAASPEGSPSPEDSSNPTYIGVFVPPNAVSATNTLLFATGGTASLWFNQNNPPLAGFPGDFELIANDNGTTPVSVVLTTNSTPSIIPGQVYYLAITNTSSITLTDAFEVTFGLFYTPPFLPAQSNLTADAGNTLVVDNTATDTNAGTLFYTLTTAPPVGATISGNGVITWNVPANQPAGNVLFTTVVSNSFTTLTATNNFTVTVLPLAQGGAPVTNTVPAGSIDWLAIDVPPDAVWATNILIYATNLPVNVLFTTNFPPSTNGAYALMSDVTNGTSILSTNTAPTNIVQGGVYYIGIQNTNTVTIGFAFEVNFGLVFTVGAPYATTLPATHVTGTAAQLNGLATPNASPAFGWFEWGASTNYGFATTQQPMAGSNLVQVVSQLPPLTPGQVYHFQLIVSNAVGVAFGGDQLFGVSGLAVWGNNVSGVTNVPVGLTNTTAIAAEASDGLALSASGKVTVWGDDTLGQTAVPAKLTNVVAIAAGEGSFALALQNGTVTGWGDNSSGQTTIPSGLSNVVAIAAGTSHSLALENNGTVVAWGANGYGQTSVPPGLSNVVAIAAGEAHSLALLNNGTVVAWGGGETNTGIFPDYGQSIVPPGLTNVIAISAYGLFSSALEANGTVVAWGENNFGQTQVPGGLNGVIGISDGLYHMLALHDNGLAVGWGNNVYGESTVPPGLTNIFAIAGGNNFSMALESPLSINLTVTPLNNGSPQTNSIAANSVAYYSVTVPANAVAATNLLSFATAPLNLWFNQTNLPVPANPPDRELLGSAGSGASATLFTNGVPPLVPGGTYYLAIQNTNNMTVNYVFGVNFETVGTLPGTNLVFFTGIIKTNISGINGYLIQWLAPTNDTFRVQQTPSLLSPTWNSFSNIVTYVGPPVTGNGLFTFFDNGSQYPFTSPDRFYRVMLYAQGSNTVAIPLNNGSPQTNTVPANSVVYYSVSVPANVIAATNLFSLAAGPLNLWFNQSTLPLPANPPDTQLLGAAGSGAAATLVTNGAPPLVPGQTYYLAIQNTNNVPVNYVFGVNFGTAATGSGGNLVFFSGIIQTNIGSTNGFLIRWLAPTNDTFQVQEIPTLTPPLNWNSFSNVVAYTGPPVPGNGLFTFFDNGAQHPLGQERFYRVVLLSGGSSGSLVIASQPNYVANASQPFSMTNNATDSNLSAILDYNLTDFPAPSTSPSEDSASGVITWTPGAGDKGAAYKFTTVVSDNSLPVRSATNAFTVFVLPAPSLGHAALTTTNVTLTWTASTNDLFQVDWATSLAPPVAWSPFPPTVFSTTGTFTLTDTNAPTVNRFYRLVWLPLP